MIDFSDFLPTISEAGNIKLDSLDTDGRSFLPQLRGEKDEPRGWIYSWYSREGTVKDARIFARNHRFKLYDTGEFYEIPKDYKEQSSLDTLNLGQETKAIYGKLSDVLKHYSRRRLDKVQVLE